MGSIQLTKAPCNLPLLILTVKGGGVWEKKFESLGIRKGKRVRKIACQPFGGPVVIEIDGSKISLGQGIASKIEVEIPALPSRHKHPHSPPR